MGSKSGASVYRDVYADLITHTKSVLKIWKQHFSNLLCGDYNESPTCGIVIQEIRIGNDCIAVPIPSH